MVKKLDSLSIKSDSLNNGKNNNINPAAYNEKTKITFKSYFTLLGSDIKQHLTLPFYTKRKDWVKVGAFALGTFAISFADKPIQKFALNLRSSKPVVSVSNYVTSFGGLYEIYTLSALASYGFIFKDEKIKTTVLLASQAYLTASFIETSVKFLTGRQRPVFIEQGAYETEPVFMVPFISFKKKKAALKIQMVLIHLSHQVILLSHLLLQPYLLWNIETSR